MRKTQQRLNIKMDQIISNPYQTKWNQQSDKCITLEDERSRSSSNQKTNGINNNSFGGGLSSTRSIKGIGKSIQNSFGSPQAFLIKDQFTSKQRMDLSLSSSRPKIDSSQNIVRPKNDSLQNSIRMKNDSFQSYIQYAGFPSSPINKIQQEQASIFKQKPWEDYLEQVKNAITLEQLTQDDQFLSKIKYAIDQVQSHVRLLEENERITKKELQKLQKINEFLQISNSKKDQIYKEAVKENIQIKYQLRNVSEQLRRKEDKFVQIQNKLGNINTFLVDSSITHDNFAISKKQDQIVEVRTNKVNQPIQTNQEYNEIEFPQQIKSKRASKVNRSQSILLFSPQGLVKENGTKEQEQQDFNIKINQNKDELGVKLEIQNSNTEVNKNQEQANQQAQTLLKKKNEDEQNNNESDEEEFGGDGDFIKKTRFNFVQHSTDFYFFTLLLDLNIGNQNIQSFKKYLPQIFIIQNQVVIEFLIYFGLYLIQIYGDISIK